LFARQGCQQVFFEGGFSDQQVDLHRALLTHAVGTGDALFEDGRIPWQLNIDDGVGSLEVEAG